MDVHRTEKIWLGPNKQIGQLCHLSKNLFNEANYLVRQEFLKTGRWIRFNELRSSLKNSLNFKGLPAQTAQETLRIVHFSWQNYFRASNDYKINPTKYLSEPRFPKYKEKYGEFILVFSNQQVRIKDGIFKLPKGIIEVQTRLSNDTKFTGARIIPMGVGYELQISYKKEVKSREEETKETNEKERPSRVLGNDLGLVNLIAMTNNIGAPPIVFKGGPVKSINQYYNKRKAVLQSQYAKQGIRTGKKLQKLTLKRNRKIDCYFHLVSRLVVWYCLMLDIDTIVLGRNKDWKLGIRLKKQTNQNFVFVPYYRLLHMIRYKAEEAGIKVIEVEEDYTSKCSFLDLESIGYHDEYKGKRIKRGLFRTAQDILINADVNGAFNHIRNAVPNALDEFMEKFMADGIEGVRIHPVRAVLD